VLSEEDLCDGNAAGLAGVASPQDGPNLGVRLGEAHIHGPAAEQHQDHRLLRGVRDALDEGLLLSRERQVQPVNLLPLLILIQPHEQDDVVRRARRLDRLGDRRDVAGGRVAGGHEARVLHVALQHLERRHRHARRAEIVAEQPGGVVRVEPDHGEGRDAGLGQRERAAVVLEQDDSVLRRFQGEVLVLLRAHLVGPDVAVPVPPGVAVEEPQPHPDGEQVVQGSVYVLLRDLPLLERRRAVLLYVAAAVHIHS
jgi:hypothetical protein